MATSSIQRYIDRQVLYPPFVEAAPSDHLGLVVVIPCFREPDLLLTLQDLWACDPTSSSVEVLVVINHSERSDEATKAFNSNTLAELKAWTEEHSRDGWRCSPISAFDLPAKQAGVGLARKIGLDEGLRRLHSADNPQGILVCLDADSRVPKNYLTAIEGHFQELSKSVACEIHYEHPVSGNAYPQEVYDSIVQYELHLRYFIEEQRKLGLPYAVQTVGSSMAVRAEAYAAVGGMNRRKAGEDFYFYHKFVQYGPTSRLTDTMVIPSPRVSDRVPFGTGRAVGEMMGRPIFKTYAPDSFTVIGDWLTGWQSAFERGEGPAEVEDKALESFLCEQGYAQRWVECRQNTRDWAAFEKRMYRWFDAFRLMKALHYLRDAGRANLPVAEAVGQARSAWQSWEPVAMLEAYRAEAKEAGSGILAG